MYDQLFEVLKYCATPSPFPPPCGSVNKFFSIYIFKQILLQKERNVVAAAAASHRMTSSGNPDDSHHPALQQAAAPSIYRLTSEGLSDPPRRPGSTGTSGTTSPAPPPPMVKNLLMSSSLLMMPPQHHRAGLEQYCFGKAPAYNLPPAPFSFYTMPPDPNPLCVLPPPSLLVPEEISSSRVSPCYVSEGNHQSRLDRDTPTNLSLRHIRDDPSTAMTMMNFPMKSYIGWQRTASDLGSSRSHNSDVGSSRSHHSDLELSQSRRGIDLSGGSEPTGLDDSMASSDMVGTVDESIDTVDIDTSSVDSRETMKKFERSDKGPHLKGFPSEAEMKRHFPITERDTNSGIILNNISTEFMIVDDFHISAVGFAKYADL